MGFTINDSIDINNTGVTVTGAYCELVRKTLQVNGRADGNYDTFIVGNVYQKKQAYQQGKAPLMQITAREIITEQQLMGNIFQRLTNILKQKYSSTTPD